MSFAIILVFSCITLFLLGFFLMLKDLDRKHPTKSLPPMPAKAIQKTVKEILKENLASPPLGCMWEVKDILKHYRKLENGRRVFDGRIDSHYAQITLITPMGKENAFSLDVSDKYFEAHLKNNVKIVLSSYAKKSETQIKQNETGWDGVYH